MKKDPFAVKDGFTDSGIKKSRCKTGGLCYNRGMKTNDIVYGVPAVTEALLANTGNKLYTPR